jgi:hypothetical protein
LESKRFKAVQYGSVRGKEKIRMREMPVFGDPENLVEREERSQRSLTAMPMSF